MTLPFVRGGTSSQPRRAGWVYRAVSCNQLQCEFTKSASESSSRLSLHPLSTSLYCKSLSVLSMHLLAPGVPLTYHFCSLSTTAGPLFLKCLIPRLSVARIPLLLLFFSSIFCYIPYCTLQNTKRLLRGRSLQIPDAPGRQLLPPPHVPPLVNTPVACPCTASSCRLACTRHYCLSLIF